MLRKKDEMRCGRHVYKLDDCFICFRSTFMSTSIAEKTCRFFPAWWPKTHIERSRRMNEPWNAIRVGSDDWKNTTDGNLPSCDAVTFVRSNGLNPAPW